MVAPSAQAYSYSAEWSVYKPRTNTVEFTIKFREPPDFFTTDAAGRAVNEFQYHVWGDKSLPYPDYWDSVIRVEQSYLAQGMLVIRGTEGFHVPDSPVWGAVRGVVPYTLTGTVLTFSVPVPVVSDHGPLFDYNLLLVSYGDFVSQRAGQVSAVPEPGIAALMLGGLALLGWRKKRRFTDFRETRL